MKKFNLANISRIDLENRNKCNLSNIELEFKLYCRKNAHIPLIFLKLLNYWSIGIIAVQ